MQALNEAGVPWVSRAPETSSRVQALVREEPPAWQQSEDGQLNWWGRTLDLPQGQERWLMVRSRAGKEQARATLQRKVKREQAQWENAGGIWATGPLPVLLTPRWRSSESARRCRCGWSSRWRWSRSPSTGAWDAPAAARRQ